MGYGHLKRVLWWLKPVRARARVTRSPTFPRQTGFWQGAVVFNADDFGMSEGVTRSIVKATDKGIIRSTTAMVCRGNDKLIRKWAPHVNGGIGLHLQLTDGIPCLPASRIRSLVTEEGQFHRSPQAFDSIKIDASEVDAEWRAQLDRLRNLGIEPTHLDSHHHIHRHPDVLPVYLALAHENRLPVRAGAPWHTKSARKAGVYCCDHTEAAWVSASANKSACIEHVGAVVSQHPDSVVEFVCHPGFDNSESRTFASNPTREVELETYCSKELKDLLEQLGVSSISMAEMAIVMERRANSASFSQQSSSTAIGPTARHGA